jgi:hypothetical protein
LLPPAYLLPNVEVAPHEREQHSGEFGVRGLALALALHHIKVFGPARNAQFAVRCIYRSRKPLGNRVRKWWKTNRRQPRSLRSNNQKFVGTIFLDIGCSQDYSPK